MAKVTKTQITINTMNANAGKPIDEVVKLIAEANSVTEQVARGAYRWVVKNGLAAGSLPVKGAVTLAGPKPAKEPKTVKLSTIVAKVNKEFKAKVAAEPKSDDEIAKIKAANLARMKAVTSKEKKFLKGQVAEDVDAVVFHTPDEAREELARIEAELDAFEAPAFLSRDAVRALV